jgi:hypothetical protein
MGDVLAVVFGVVYAKRGVDCWVVRGTEWPLNIVFRPGSSENNAVAWRGW